MIIDWTSVVSGVIVAIAAVIAIRLTITSQKSDRSKWEGSVEARLVHLEKFLEKIDLKIDKITDKILPLFSHVSRKVIGSDSPLRLTDFGKEIAEKLNADHWADQLAETVKEEVKGKEPYNIQEFSFKYVQDDDHYSDEDRQFIRNVAYEKGVSENQVREVIGIELKDKLLEIEGESAP